MTFDEVDETVKALGTIPFDLILGEVHGKRIAFDPKIFADILREWEWLKSIPSDSEFQFARTNRILRGKA